MTGKRAGWWLALLCGVALVGAVGVAVAHGEEEQREHRLVVLGGHAWLGVWIDDVTPERAQELELPAPTGAVIEGVEEDSPAAQAGLQENDVILGFAGERVRSAAQLRRLVRETPPGRTATVEVSRAGQTRSLEVVLEERRPRVLGRRIPLPEVRLPEIEIPDFDVHIFGHRARLGISGDQLTPQLAEYFGVKQGRGVLVREVLAGSPAAKAGLQAGDVIVRVGQEEVSSVGGLRRALASEREGKQVMLTIVRSRREQTIKVELEEPRRYSPRRTAEFDVVVPPERWAQYEMKLGAAAEEMEQHLQGVEEKIKKALESREWQEKMRGFERDLEQLEQKLETAGEI